jgi:hypothetical protein
MTHEELIEYKINKLLGPPVSEETDTQGLQINMKNADLNNIPGEMDDEDSESE